MGLKKKKEYLAKNYCKECGEIEIKCKGCFNYYCPKCYYDFCPQCVHKTEYNL